MFANNIFNMTDLLSNIKIAVPEKIYIKDPETSQLGKKIIEQSILLIHEEGFDNFNFKKLGSIIGSNESSIYRYFENKHKLLLYLTSWYWAWIEYQLVFETYNLPSEVEKLSKAIEVVTRSIKEDSNYSHIDETILNKIIINENSKSFLTKEVDEENKEGFFIVYKRIVYRLKEMILAVNSNYKFASSLASMIIEASLHQHFLKDHFSSITDCNSDEDPTEFLSSLTLNLLK